MNSKEQQHPSAPQQTVVIQSAPSNGLGVAGFVTSLVSLFLSCGLLSPVSMLLSLIGLMKRPRGFAIAGSIISGLQLLIILAVGLGPILAVVGIGAAAHAEQKELFEDNRTEILQTLRTTKEYGDIRELQSEYFFVGDEEFKQALEKAKARVPNPHLMPEPSLDPEQEIE